MLVDFSDSIVCFIVYKQVMKYQQTYIQSFCHWENSIDISVICAMQGNEEKRFGLWYWLSIFQSWDNNKSFFQDIVTSDFSKMWNGPSIYPNIE